jgi:hypothetical protein
MPLLSCVPQEKKIDFDFKNTVCRIRDPLLFPLLLFVSFIEFGGN